MVHASSKLGRAVNSTRMNPCPIPDQTRSAIRLARKQKRLSMRLGGGTSASRYAYPQLGHDRDTAFNLRRKGSRYGCGRWHKRKGYENVRTRPGYVCSARTADGSNQPTACLAQRSRHRFQPDQTIGVGGARKSSFASAKLPHGVIVTPGIPTSQVIISHVSSSPLCERATSRTQRIRRGLPASSSAGTPSAPTIGQSTVCSS